MLKSRWALLGAFLLSSAAYGQSAQVAPAAPLAQAAILTPAPGTTSVLRAGTQVPLRLAEALTTEHKAVKVGQRVQLEVAEAVTLNGQIVIPAGSPALAEVTDVRNKGMWGKSGKINARLLYVRANGQQIRLSGQFDDKGKTGTAGVVGAVAFVPVAGFFVTGTSAKIALGTPVTGFVDEDVPVAFASAPPAMMVVPAPASAPAQPAAGAAAPASSTAPSPSHH